MTYFFIMKTGFPETSDVVFFFFLHHNFFKSGIFGEWRHHIWLISGEKFSLLKAESFRQRSDQ